MKVSARPSPTISMLARAAIIEADPARPLDGQRAGEAAAAPVGLGEARGHRLDRAQMRLHLGEAGLRRLRDERRGAAASASGAAARARALKRNIGFFFRSGIGAHMALAA